MKYFVYIIKGQERNYIHVGLTNNYVRRVKQHNDGRELTTAPYRPFLLLHIEEFSTRIEARKREEYLKSGCGKEWIKKTFITL